MGIDLTCLFKSGLSYETNKDSVIKSLNRYDSTSKLKKFRITPRDLKTSSDL